MTGSPDESLDLRLARAFVELADTLTDDFDAVDFLHKLAEWAVELLPAEAAGVIVADHRGNLRAVTSSDQVRRLEILELEQDEGPTLDCYRSGRPVQEADLTARGPTWPRLAVEAGRAGYRSVTALPMRLRSDVIGALDLYSSARNPPSGVDLQLGQTLADVATIGLLQQRTARRRGLLVEQLQLALSSRVGVEQAKGVVAERSGLSMDEAFTMLRDYARDHQRLLSDVARDVVDGVVLVAEPPSA